MKKQPLLNSWFSGLCKRNKKKMSRGSTFKIFGDRSVMSKIDLFMKSEIIDEALEKECHEIEVDDSGHKYIFENYASRIYSNVRKIYDIKNEDLSA